MLAMRQGGQGTHSLSPRTANPVASVHPSLLTAAANVGTAEQTSAPRKTRMAAGGADNGLHRADDDGRLAGRDVVIAGKRNDVHAVLGQRRQLVLHPVPQPFQGAVQPCRRAREVVLSSRRDDGQRHATKACDPTGDRKSTRLNSSHTEQSRMPSSA